jgi:hypothetical protein
MNQLVAKETLKGLLHAPVPACSCAKGLAVGAVHAWDALKELAGIFGLSNSSEPSSTPAMASPVLHSSVREHPSQRPGVQKAIDAMPDTQAARATAAAEYSSPPNVPDLLSEDHGLTAQQHTVYMRTMMLHAASRHQQWPWQS